MHEDYASNLNNEDDEGSQVPRSGTSGEKSSWMEDDFTIRSQINHVLDELNAQTGWHVSTVKFARNILGGIVSKVLNDRGTIIWRNDFERGEWHAIFDLATAVQDFMFYRPMARELMETFKVNNDGTTTTETILSKAPPNQMKPLKFRRSRKQFGIHMRAGVAEDINLAKSFVKLLNQLGLRRDLEIPVDVTSSKGRNTWNHAMWLLTAFEDFVDLFTEAYIPIHSAAISIDSTVAFNPIDRR